MKHIHPVFQFCIYAYWTVFGTVAGYLLLVYLGFDNPKDKRDNTR